MVYGTKRVKELDYLKDVGIYDGNVPITGLPKNGPVEHDITKRLPKHKKIGGDLADRLPI